MLDASDVLNLEFLQEEGEGSGIGSLFENELMIPKTTDRELENREGELTWKIFLEYSVETASL